MINSLILKQLEDRGWIEVIGTSGGRWSSGTVCNDAPVPG
jgi:hypothetical protein